MSLESEFHECIINDNVAEFDRIWAAYGSNIMVPLLLKKLYDIALFGSIRLFDKVFVLDAVTRHFGSPKERKDFVTTVLGHSSLPLVNRLFEIQMFRDEIVTDPFSVVAAVANNRSCAPQALAKIQELTSVDEFMTLEENRIWFKAYVDYNYPAMNCFLEFPEVYAMVDALDPKHSHGPRYINTRFMEYYFANFPQGDLTEKQAKLAYQILLTLIRTYPERDEIRNQVKSIAQTEEDMRHSNTFFYRTSKAAKNLRDQYMPDTTNVHAQRIQKLIWIPEVSRLASEHNFSGTVYDAAKMLLAEGPARHKLVF